MLTIEHSDSEVPSYSLSDYYIKENKKKDGIEYKLGTGANVKDTLCSVSRSRRYVSTGMITPHLIAMVTHGLKQ